MEAQTVSKPKKPRRPLTERAAELVAGLKTQEDVTKFVSLLGEQAPFVASAVKAEFTKQLPGG